MTFWSLFTGIGGFDLAFTRAGMNGSLQCEIDAECRSVLERHYPGDDRIDDVERLRALLEPRNAKRVAREFVRPDGICGGFPCQDLSVAGKRAGLAGGRSGLWFVFRRVVALIRPRWVCIENVPGLLSSNGGRDMGTILRSLGDMGYGWAYRVLDAQWFGVAQRRRRVFIVGCLGDWRRAGEILFEPDRLPWDSAPRRETQPSLAGTIDAGAGVRRGAGVNPGTIVNTLDRHMGGGGPDDNAAQAGHLIHCPTISPAIKARDFKGPSSDGDGDGDGAPIIAHTLRGSQAGETSDMRPSMAVRRLTPTECERLQAFPDGWSRFGHDGREISDSGRYRMLGNAVCVRKLEWIGRRIV